MNPPAGTNAHHHPSPRKVGGAGAESHTAPADKLRVLDLFSGIGGFSLGLERTGGFETVAFCEIEEFPRRVLAKHWPNVPIFEDVRKLRGSDVGAVDVICGGFPCQDISSAGKKVGIGGVKSSLWREFSRLIGEIRPRFAIVENSAGLLNRGAGDVFGDLAERRYDAEWQCIPASALGAPHGRDRIWIVAYPDDESKPNRSINDEACRVPSPRGHDASNAEPRKQQVGRVMARVGRFWEPTSVDRFWKTENSPIGMGVDDGLPDRMDRLRALGNAVVPQIPELIGRAILDSIQSEARIHELRQAGHVIDTDMVETDGGAHVARYRLVKA